MFDLFHCGSSNDHFRLTTQTLKQMKHFFLKQRINTSLSNHLQKSGFRGWFTCHVITSVIRIKFFKNLWKLHHLLKCMWLDQLKQRIHISDVKNLWWFVFKNWGIQNGAKEKGAGFNTEILNTVDATAIWNWETKRAAFSLLSEWERHTLFPLSVTMTLTNRGHLFVFLCRRLQIGLK